MNPVSQNLSVVQVIGVLIGLLVSPALAQEAPQQAEKEQAVSAPDTVSLEDLKRQLDEARSQLETMQAEIERLSQSNGQKGTDSEQATETPSAAELIGSLELDIQQAIKEAKQAKKEAAEQVARAQSDALKGALEARVEAADAMEELAEDMQLHQEASGHEQEFSRESRAAAKEFQERMRQAREALRDAERQARHARRQARSFTDIVGEGESRKGDRLSLVSDSVVKAGETVPELVVLAGHGEVYGEVTGDATVMGGDLIVHKGGRIGGDAMVMAGRIKVEDGGVIEGERVVLSPGNFPGVIDTEESSCDTMVPLPPGGHSFFSRLRGGIILYLVLVAAGLLSLTFVPKRVRNVGRTLEDRAWTSGLVGVLTLIALLPVTVFLAVTVVGLLVIPFAYGGLMLAGLMGLSALAQVLSRRIPLRRGPRTPGGTILWGMAIYSLAAILPYIGIVLGITGLVFALGAVVLSRFGEQPEII